ncbi:DMT family transporter [Vibrio sp. F74]|uniref:DMT family transporter n=1 Tax=Vibrio sp. F74 TaxID=700020 RepID=UPI0035F53F96
MVLGLIASLIWGSWPVISKLATIQNLSAIDITLIRFTIAGIVLFPVLIYKSISVKMITKKGVLLTIGAGAPYVFLAITGIKYSSSAHFGMIAPSTMLLFSTIGSVIFFSESIKPIKAFGIILILSGVLIIGINGIKSIDLRTLFGDIMFALCGFLWAYYTLLSKHWCLNSWVSTSLVSVVSCMVCLPILTFNLASIMEKVSAYDLLVHGIYQGIVVAIVALYCYSKSVFILGAAKGAIFACLVPPFSLILGVFFLDESLGKSELIGIICVFSGMILSLEIISLRRIRHKTTTISRY